MSGTVQRFLVIGATGATGRRLVAQLLERGCAVTAVARSRDRLPEAIRDHPHLRIVEGNLLDLDRGALVELVADVDGVASCLGHRASFRGVFGPPYRLVTKVTRRLCAALAARGAPVRYVLMSSSGVRDRAAGEGVSFAQKVVILLLRILIPPHADNEAAAAFLRRRVDPGGPVRWVAVRPDTLREGDEVTPVVVHPAPTRSAIFDAGETHRINVAAFMADLLTDDALAERWTGQMPVVYDEGHD